MIIYCDMDGVLCDFERQWARVNKLPFSKFSSLNMHDRWEKVRQHGSYWETIPWKGDGRTLWNYIKKHERVQKYNSSLPIHAPHTYQRCHEHFRSKLSNI